MSKIAVITIISLNYGNRLQNYAIQETLKKLGHQVVTIPMEGESRVYQDIKYIIKKTLNLVTSKYEGVVWKQFDRNICWGKYVIEGHEERANSDYDFFVAGSDQIWNPMFDITSDRELLTFAKSEKRIAYAASIGLSEFPSKERVHYAKEWCKFKAISVREKQASKIIEDLTGIKPTIVLDPTMLLTKEEWKKFINKTPMKDKYCVKYFLGDRNPKFEKNIRDYLVKKQIKCIDITNQDGTLKAGIGPQEFLNILFFSECVFTDSFHGSAFSILFEKPFIVFQRPAQVGYGDMNSRLDTLLETFELERQRVMTEDVYEFDNMNWDFANTEEILRKKREEGLQFLKEAIQ